MIIKQRYTNNIFLVISFVTFYISGCVSNHQYATDDKGFYDEEFIKLKNTDMSNYSSIEQFSEHKQFCERDEDCHVIYYGDAGCGDSRKFIFSAYMGYENIKHLEKIADNTEVSDAGYDSVCLPIGARISLMYCDDICRDAYAEIGKRNELIGKLEGQLEQCTIE